METQTPTTFIIEVEQEDDGRWIAEVIELPGVLVYGASQDEAIKNVKALALRVIADQLEHGETESSLSKLSFCAV